MPSTGTRQGSSATARAIGVGRGAGSARPGEALISTAARIIRWAPTSDERPEPLRGAHRSPVLDENGPSRISDLAVAEKTLLPADDHQPRQATGGRRAWSPGRPIRTDAPSVDDRRHPARPGPLAEMRRARAGQQLEPYLAQLARTHDRAALTQGIDGMRQLMSLLRPCPGEVERAPGRPGWVGFAG